MAGTSSRSASITPTASTPSPTGLTPPAPGPAATSEAFVTAREVLSRSTAAELATARAHRDALVAAAVALTSAAGHDPDLATCAQAGCGHAAVPDGPALCAMAHRLARLPDAPATPPAVPFLAAVAHFRSALVGSADAIRACRQTAHPGDDCWFSPVPGLDGCGEVLRLLHRCG